jgi:hypothetical protein
VKAYPPQLSPYLPTTHDDSLGEVGVAPQLERGKWILLAPDRVGDVPAPSEKARRHGGDSNMHSTTSSSCAREWGAGLTDTSTPGAPRARPNWRGRGTGIIVTTMPPPPELMEPPGGSS